MALAAHRRDPTPWYWRDNGGDGVIVVVMECAACRGYWQGVTLPFRSASGPRSFADAVVIGLGGHHSDQQKGQGLLLMNTLYTAQAGFLAFFLAPS